MSELREADRAAQERMDAIEIKPDDLRGPWPFLFLGMDLDPEEVWTLSGEHTGASMLHMGSMLASRDDGAIDAGELASYIQSSWLDVFAVACMLWLRRREGNTR